MLDPSPIADASPAVSSPAPESSSGPADSLDNLSASDLHAWRMTGAMPDPTNVPASTAGTPPAEPVEQAVSTETEVEAASEPATATDDPPLKAKTQARIDELLAERARERERADRAEQRNREYERTHQPTPDARPAASSAAPAAASTLVKPDPEAYAYGTADPGYLEALTDYKVAATLAAERATWEQGQAAARQRDESQRVVTAFHEKAAKARARHPDFDAVALQAPTEIPAGSAADLWILEDEAGAEILYHLQQPAQTAERQRILALGPREQLKELVRLGDRLTAAAPPAKSTNAPPPPPTLGTRAAPSDPVEKAIADDDTAAYNAAMNRRELARLKA